MSDDIWINSIDPKYEIECGDLIDIKFERATGISGFVMSTQPLTITSIYCNELFNTVIIGSFQTISIIKKKKYANYENYINKGDDK